MGVDLNLKVARFGDKDCTTIDLDTDRSYVFYSYFCDIGRTSIQPVCKPTELEPGHFIYEYRDDGITKVTEDPYGNRLTYVWAAEIKRIPTENLSDWNRAALAYIRELPNLTRVYLWWS